MWCKTCNIETNEDLCPVCGSATIEDIPTEVYWCAHCETPVIQAATQADKGFCPLCKRKMKYVLMSGEDISVALRSLNDDFVCIVNTYLPRYKSTPGRISPENNIDCPLGELGFIDILSKEKRTYKKSIPAAKSFSPWIILAVIVDQVAGRAEIALNELLTAPCNIGRIFNMDAITMLDVLHRAESCFYAYCNDSTKHYHPGPDLQRC